jgi:hypothetical protein
VKDIDVTAAERGAAALLLAMNELDGKPTDEFTRRAAEAEPRTVTATSEPDRSSGRSLGLSSRAARSLSTAMADQVLTLDLPNMLRSFKVDYKVFRNLNFATVLVDLKPGSLSNDDELEARMKEAERMLENAIQGLEQRRAIDSPTIEHQTPGLEM